MSLLILVVAIVVSAAGVAYAVTRSDSSAVQCPAGYGYVYGQNVRGHCAPLPVVPKKPSVPTVSSMVSQRSGPVEGTVVSWNDEEGWGVISSPAVEGEVWTHFSNIEGSGYKALRRGEAVRFTYETPGQDGFPHRAVSVEAR